MRKLLVALVLAALMMGSALALSGSVAAERDDPSAPRFVGVGETDRLGGGKWVLVRAGETAFGVIYGTPERPNAPVIFAEYTQYLGGAEIYDGSGNFLRRTGIPVHTVFYQRLNALVEFRVAQEEPTFDFRLLEDGDLHPNRPEKVLSLRDAWTLTNLAHEPTEAGLIVTFNISLYDRPYTLVWGEEPMPRHGTLEDGVVEEVTFGFRLTINKHEIHPTEVPWFRVTVADGREREILDSEFIGTKTFEGTAVSVGAKYDHYFEGWDFVTLESRLALETHVVTGHFASKPVAQWLQAQYGRDEAHEAEDPTDPEQYRFRETDSPEEGPVLLTKDSIYFDDEWHRVGRLGWVSDVEVDGEPARMRFQIHRAEPMGFAHEGNVFRGISLKGAYLYPAAERTLFHDPEFAAMSTELALPAAYNLVPALALLAQAAVIALAILAAVLVALMRRRRRS